MENKPATTFDKVAWAIAALVLLAWAIGFAMALLMAQWPPLPN